MFEANAQAQQTDDRYLVTQMLAFERISWDMYFSGLVAFQLHPGNHVDPAKIDLEPYAQLADRMLLKRRERY